jgi:hypothetical protein
MFPLFPVVPSPPEDPTLHPNWDLFEHEKCGLSQADRIIGGRDAELGAYPWIARIGYTRKLHAVCIHFK